jgi:hypothetical protein
MAVGLAPLSREGITRLGLMGAMKYLILAVAVLLSSFGSVTANALVVEYDITGFASGSVRLIAESLK